MKKKLFLPFLLIIILALFLAGCDEESPVTDPSPDSNRKEEEEDRVMEDFRKLADKNHPYNIKAFIDENIERVSEEDASEMVGRLDRSLINNIGIISDEIFTLDQEGELMEVGSVDFFFDREKIQEIYKEDLRQEVEMAFDNGYKLINVEGNYHPIVDYNTLEEYNDYISQELTDYLAVMVMDSDSPPFVDGGMMIEYDELADRILKTEEYLITYPESIRYDKMLDLYGNKLDNYLRGVPNTQIYDYSTNEIYDSAYDSFTRTSQLEDSITADVTGKYLEAIDENNRIIDTTILDQGEELVREAVNNF